VPFADLRSAFPVLREYAYLNAGSCGPVPQAAAEAAGAAALEQARSGRAGSAHWEAASERWERLREGYAAWLGCDASDVALTGSTTDGVNSVLNAMSLGAGDEVLTSDQEHPGVLTPLASLRERRGIVVRTVPFESIAAAVTDSTRLVAVSHVSWISGQVVDTAGLAAAPAPVLLDGAQGVGAIGVDVKALGCDAYAGSGQKWLCGPEGTGMIFLSALLRARMTPPAPSYGALEDPLRALDPAFHPDARAFDAYFPATPVSEWALTSMGILAGPGIEATTARGPVLAARLAGLLADAGREVVARGETTLVAWRSDDPAAEVERLAAAGVLLRDLPGRGLVRASVGAWNDESDLERLISSS